MKSFMYESVVNLFYCSHSNLEQLRSTLDNFDHPMFLVDFLNEYKERPQKKLIAFRPT